MLWRVEPPLAPTSMTEGRALQEPLHATDEAMKSRLVKPTEIITTITMTISKAMPQMRAEEAQVEAEEEMRMQCPTIGDASERC